MKSQNLGEVFCVFLPDSLDFTFLKKHHKTPFFSNMIFYSCYPLIF